MMFVFQAACVLIIAVSPLVGCEQETHADLPETTRHALENAEHFELLTLLPRRDIPEESEVPDETTSSDDTSFFDDAERFHGEVVLGRAAVKDQSDRVRLIEALRDAARDAEDAADCFDPRHGIHIKIGEQSLDLVICFACSQVRVYDSRSSQHTEFMISIEQRDVFNRIAEDLGLELTYREQNVPVDQ